MPDLVYYVIRQRGGWGVQHDGRVRSGHPTREQAVACARTLVTAVQEQGQPCRLRIQADAGAWIEERSFAPME